MFSLCTSPCLFFNPWFMQFNTGVTLRCLSGVFSSCTDAWRAPKTRLIGITTVLSFPLMVTDPHTRPIAARVDECNFHSSSPALCLDLVWFWEEHV